MVEAATVDRLLETIERRLARLEEASGVPLERYRTDRDLQDIVERNFELAIQAAIDLGLHLLADRPHPLPETSRAVFEALAR
ncbi:MAG: type VII toxin-antitoxin system HepT family RNase toxin, partial [Gemmatimonadota bacterium]